MTRGRSRRRRRVRRGRAARLPRRESRRSTDGSSRCSPSAWRSASGRRGSSARRACRSSIRSARSGRDPPRRAAAREQGLPTEAVREIFWHIVGHVAPRAGRADDDRRFGASRVVGLGLMGGSLARELAARGVRVLGYDRDAELARCGDARRHRARALDATLERHRATPTSSSSRCRWTRRLPLLPALRVARRSGAPR